MRLPFAVMMAIVVQLSGASATSVSADGPVAVTIVDHLLNAAHDSITTSTRLLRTVDADSKTETSGEDRLNIPGLETLSHYVWKLFGSPVNGKTIQGWLRKDTSEIEAFKLLKLDKAGDKLLASSKFRGWLRYVEERGLKTGKQIDSNDTTPPQACQMTSISAVGDLAFVGPSHIAEFNDFQYVEVVGVHDSTVTVKVVGPDVDDDEETEKLFSISQEM
ncbi:unnamed protein product [Phytophthora fragariaefolia]|uniref:Unnamed protein product n=1 Tax=Phytophthora fragariaefolia TaxID=1490495 RepID=A0A9W6XK30_9STRA|nr:unnamed protein product [Phytophthora fragariaefolia]